MMHKDLFIAVVKSGGRILRERDFTRAEASVQLPFGSEFSISMKNLHTERAAVRITIDGQDVLNGRDLIVMPNKELELERFLEDLRTGNRFKFIKKTEEISEHRGDKIDDGFIRVEWQYEKPLTLNNGISVTRSRADFVQPFDPDEYEKKLAREANDRLTSREVHTSGGIWYSAAGHQGPQGPSGPQGCQGSQGPAGRPGGVFRGMLGGSVGCPIATQDQSVYNVSVGASMSFCDTVLEDGITVKGSLSTQAFQEDTLRELEAEKHVFIFRLKGFAQDAVVVKPLTTRDKLTCPTCGRTASSASNCCSNCGTALAVRVGA
jgi:hypothetical protein